MIMDVKDKILVSSVSWRPLRVGLIACWASFLALPLVLTAIGGGPCIGPRDGAGSIILLASGFGGMIAAGYGINRVSRGFRESSQVERMFGVLSARVACFAAVIEVFYVWISVLALQVYLRM